jgi:hypothetical protein
LRQLRLVAGRRRQHKSLANHCRFSSVYPFLKNAVKTTALGPFLGKGVYVVDVLTWTWTPVFYVAFFLVWYLLSIYNEKTEKFVITF